MNQPVMLSNIALAEVCESIADKKRAEQLRRYDEDPLDGAATTGSVQTLRYLAEALRAMSVETEAAEDPLVPALRERAERTIRDGVHSNNSVTKAARQVVSEALEGLADDLSPAKPDGGFW